MSQDRLLAATRALRQARSGASDTADATEARILARAQERRRPKRLHWLLPIAAVLAVSSAWAGSQPGLRAAASSAWQRLRAPGPQASPPSRPSQESTSTLASAEPVVAPPPPAETRTEPAHAPLPPLAPSPGSSSRAAVVSARPAAGAERAVEPPPELPTPPAPTPLKLYRRAHELHFRAHDFAAALPAWDRYLAGNAAGSLALEARYNRAICLTQLGRRDEAKAALLPFARGDYGGYRQAEAQRLIDSSTATP